MKRMMERRISLAGTLTLLSGESPYSGWWNLSTEKTNRLNYNHWLMKDLSGYLLNPNIKIGENARVADIGTGTG